MTKLLTSTAVLLALAAPGMVRADTLPKEILGQWCVDGAFGNGVGAGLYDKGKCKKDRDDGIMTVKPNSVEYWEDGCNFTSIATRTATGQYYDKSKLRSETYKVYEVRAKCVGEGDKWNSTLFFTYFGHGRLQHYSFIDNELPFDTKTDDDGKEVDSRTFCQAEDDGYYVQGNCDGKGIQISFEKDRYNIVVNGEGRGFCRFTDIKTVWDPNLGVATKSQGGPVTFITSKCPKGVTQLATFESKGSVFLMDKEKYGKWQ
jgi:hypothetical protein